MLMLLHPWEQDLRPVDLGAYFVGLYVDDELHCRFAGPFRGGKGEAQRFIAAYQRRDY